MIGLALYGLISTLRCDFLMMHRSRVPHDA
jgi:hypothetical protein